MTYKYRLFLVLIFIGIIFSANKNNASSQQNYISVQNVNFATAVRGRIGALEPVNPADIFEEATENIHYLANIEFNNVPDDIQEVQIRIVWQGQNREGSYVPIYTTNFNILRNILNRLNSRKGQIHRIYAGGIPFVGTGIIITSLQVREIRSGHTITPWLTINDTLANKQFTVSRSVEAFRTSPAYTLEYVKMGKALNLTNGQIQNEATEFTQLDTPHIVAYFSDISVSIEYYLVIEIGPQGNTQETFRSGVERHNIWPRTWDWMSIAGRVIGATPAPWRIKIFYREIDFDAFGQEFVTPWVMVGSDFIVTN